MIRNSFDLFLLGVCAIGALPGALTAWVYSLFKSDSRAVKQTGWGIMYVSSLIYGIVAILAAIIWSAVKIF